MMCAVLMLCSMSCSPATLLAGELIGPPVVMVMREKDKGSYTGSRDLLNVKTGDIIDVT